MDERSLKTIPQWAWALSVLFFPHGMFIAFGVVGLISWKRSIAFVLGTYACVIAFVMVMMHLESTHASYLARAIALTAGNIFLILSGYFVYHTGAVKSYWSNKSRYVWRRMKLLAFVIIALCGVNIALAWFLRDVQLP